MPAGSPSGRSGVGVVDPVDVSSTWRTSPPVADPTTTRRCSASWATKKAGGISTSTGGGPVVVDGVGSAVVVEVG